VATAVFNVSVYETPGSQLVLDRPGEPVDLTATAREIGDDALDEVIPEAFRATAGAQLIGRAAPSGASDLWLFVWTSPDSRCATSPDAIPAMASRSTAGRRPSSAVTACGGRGCLPGAWICAEDEGYAPLPCVVSAEKLAASANGLFSGDLRYAG
jgi:hypothetical protein